MSKFTLGQRQFPMLGLRSQQPKNYVGPTLSCYLGNSYCLAFRLNWHTFQNQSCVSRKSKIRKRKKKAIRY